MSKHHDVTLKIGPDTIKGKIIGVDEIEGRTATTVEFPSHNLHFDGKIFQWIPCTSTIEIILDAPKKKVKR